MKREITLDDLRTTAQRAGLELSDDDLRGLLAGVVRSKKQAGELRALISLDTEPAGTFNASRLTRK